MKIKHVKSKVVLPEENYWYDINYNTEIATCSRCKRRGKIRTTITKWGGVTQSVILIVPLVVLL